MTDRELLEAAAKAAGVEHGADRLDCGLSLSRPPRHLPKWNPLTDDGDALRLAVKLRLRICTETADGSHVYVSHDVLRGGLTEPHGDDVCAATRRAIVRAAAMVKP
jgi:hypothetical protein